MWIIFDILNIFDDSVIEIYKGIGRLSLSELHVHYNQLNEYDDYYNYIPLLPPLLLFLLHTTTTTTTTTTSTSTTTNSTYHYYHYYYHHYYYIPLLHTKLFPALET